MKLAVITDSSAFLQAETLRKEDLFVLDIPVNIDEMCIRDRFMTYLEIVKRELTERLLPNKWQS